MPGGEAQQGQEQMQLDPQHSVLIGKDAAAARGGLTGPNDAGPVGGAMK